MLESSKNSEDIVDNGVSENQSENNRDQVVEDEIILHLGEDEENEAAWRVEDVIWEENNEESEFDSIPPLATTESESSDLSDYSQNNSDSGMVEEAAGNVTNLCRRRNKTAVPRGIVTETGPFIPVSLGFSGESAGDSDWEEVLDEQGRPTGVERKSFRLNVVNGETESIDENWDMVRRLNGLHDGTNNRRVVMMDEMGFSEASNEDMYEQETDTDGYQAGSSESESLEAERNPCSRGCTRSTLSQSGSMSSVDVEVVNEIEVADNYIDNQGCTRSTLSRGCTRSTLRYSIGGDVNGNDKGCTRSTLSPQTGDRLNVDGLARTCTTLRSLKGPECERKGQSVKCNSQECEYQSQENYEFLCCLMLFVVQWIWMLIVISNGIRGACEAAAGGGTTAALPVSSSDDGLHAEGVETLAIGDVVSANDNDMDENRMQSDDPKSKIIDLSLDG